MLQCSFNKTQELVVKPDAREKVKTENKEFRSADKKVEQLAGNHKNKEAIYDAASKIFADMVKSANGDAQKMQEIIDKAQKDPKAFYENYVSDGNKELIRGIAQDIGKIKVDSKNP